MLTKLCFEMLGVQLISITCLAGPHRDFPISKRPAQSKAAFKTYLLLKSLDIVFLSYFTTDENGCSDFRDHVCGAHDM